MTKDELRKRITTGKGARLLQQTISLSSATEEKDNKLLRSRSSWNPDNELRKTNNVQIPAAEQFEHNVLYKNTRDKKVLKEMAPDKNNDAMQAIPARIMRGAMRTKGPKTNKGEFDEFEDSYTLALSAIVLGEIDHLQAEMHEIYRQEDHPVDRGLAVTAYVMGRLGGSIQKLMGASAEIQNKMTGKNPQACANLGKLKQNPAAHMTFLGELIDETINDTVTGPMFAKMLNEEIPALEKDVKKDVEKKRTDGVPFHSGIHGKRPGEE
jgi:hypothetical protein